MIAWSSQLGSSSAAILANLRGDEVRCPKSKVVTTRESSAGKMALSLAAFTLAALLLGTVGGLSLSILLPLSMVVAGMLLIIKPLRKRRDEQRYVQQLQSQLPILMEQLVMAVQAGLDILPAIKAVLGCHSDGSRRNPARELLSQAFMLTERGIAFEESLATVSKSVDCAALRHAFLHLGVAYREGGELTAPLRELSDATQLLYQESAEENLARLPVKATMPLLMTFAGLIIIFLAVPIVQLAQFASKAAGGMP